MSHSKKRRQMQHDPRDLEIKRLKDKIAQLERQREEAATQPTESQALSTLQTTVWGVLDAQDNLVFLKTTDGEFVRLDVVDKMIEIGLEFTTIRDEAYHASVLGDKPHIDAFAEKREGDLFRLVGRMRNLIASIGVSSPDSPDILLALAVARQIENAITQSKTGHYDAFRALATTLDSADMITIWSEIKTRGRHKKQALQWELGHIELIKKQFRQEYPNRKIYDWKNYIMPRLLEHIEHEPMADASGEEKPWVGDIKVEIEEILSDPTGSALSDFRKKLDAGKRRARKKRTAIPSSTPQKP
jgi:hypothetical protein